MQKKRPARETVRTGPLCREGTYNRTEPEAMWFRLGALPKPRGAHHLI
jgi:hypothetical protein